ncbi:MAG: glutamate racemase [Chthoniobacterales bacterium]
MQQQSNSNCELSSHSDDPIGVFDSGVGGLTVVAALQRYLPYEKILYVGDTARVPYGGKSPETITRYSKEIAHLLFEQKAKMIVIACNTASALALPTLKNLYAAPIQGVIEPGAAAAVKATRNGIIGVIGTRATIASNAYQEALHRLSPEAHIISLACPLLVPLAEEGLFEDEITNRVLYRYLEPMLSQGIDTLVLGCTHYPLLKNLIARIIGPHVTLVDSAENCALAVESLLIAKGLARNHNKPTSTKLEVLLTDPAEDFLHVAAKALEIKIDHVTITRLQ